MIKASVDLRGLKPPMCIAFTIACEVYRNYGGICWITSASDSQHGPNSLHYQGLALDLRTNTLHPDTVVSIHRELKLALGPQFDCVLEDDHIHLEYDPKEPAKAEA